MTLAVICALGYGIKKMNAKTGTENLLDASKLKKKKSAGQVDKEFANRVIELIKKLVPSWKCRETGQVLVLACLLVVRTWMSIWLADVNGRVVKAIINKDLGMFIRRVSFNNILFFLLSDFCFVLIRSAFIHCELGH